LQRENSGNVLTLTKGTEKLCNEEKLQLAILAATQMMIEHTYSSFKKLIYSCAKNEV
jgi:hypothetical protein